MNNLGNQFADSVASWRRLMAALPDAEGRWRVFEEAAWDIARYVPKGVDRVEAVDHLQNIATAYGLVDTDTVQQIISDALKEIVDVVPDEPTNGIGNGHK